MWLLVVVLLLGLSREALGFHLPRKTEQRLDNSLLNQGYNYQTKFFTQEVKLCSEDRVAQKFNPWYLPQYWSPLLADRPLQCSGGYFPAAIPHKCRVLGWARQAYLRLHWQ